MYLCTPFKERQAATVAPRQERRGDMSTGVAELGGVIAAKIQPVISHPRRRRCCLCLNSIEISSTARHNFNRQDGRRLRNNPVRCSVYLLSSRRRHVTGSWTQSAFLHGISPAPAGDTDTDVQMPIVNATANATRGVCNYFND